MFKQAGTQDTFIRKFSASAEKLNETELLVDFEFLTKQEMADMGKSPNLGKNLVNFPKPCVVNPEVYIPI